MIETKLFIQIPLMGEVQLDLCNKCFEGRKILDWRPVPTPTIATANVIEEISYGGLSTL